VRRAADGERELVNLNWGFVLLQKDRAPRRVTNVRDDKILTSLSGVRHSSSAAAWCPRRRTASPRE
jgi:putative SOS response-associated peptidase YedK